MTLREKRPNMGFFLVRIQSECGKIRTRKNSVFGHFSRSVNVSNPQLQILMGTDLSF